MPVTPPQLSEVPGKPGWLRSAVIDGDHGSWVAERDRIAASFDAKEFHVFWASSLGDEAEPPPGWLQSQREKIAKGMPAEEARTMLEGETFDYFPVRIFVVPREATPEIIREFRVGTNNQKDDEAMNATAVRVEAVNRIVPACIVSAGESALQLVFVEEASLEQCRDIEMLFPFNEVSDIELGLEGYLSDWDPDEEWFLAERFQQEQGISLWWD